MSHQELAVVRDERARVTREELESLRDVVRNVIAPKATDDELTFFFKVCESVQLDPFKKQIYLIPRWDSRASVEVHQPQSAIDGLRAIAQRTGKYRGQKGPFWTGRDKHDEEGKPLWTDCWLDPNNPPAAAKIAVLHADFDEPLWAVAVWEAYVQTYTRGDQTLLAGQWGKSGYNQLAKCAEALALRRAFPEETAGLVTVDEVASEYEDGQQRQAEGPVVVPINAGEALHSDVDEEAPRDDTAVAADAAAAAEAAAKPAETNPPWDGYDGQNVRLIHAKLDETTDRALIERVKAYEAATKQRAGVLTKCEYRLAEIPDEAEGAPAGDEPEAGAAAAPPPAPFVAPAPAPADDEPPPAEVIELSPAERLEKACRLTNERWPDAPGWAPDKVLGKAAELFEHEVHTFNDLTAEEIDSIWDAIPPEIQEEVTNGTTG